MGGDAGDEVDPPPPKKAKLIRAALKARAEKAEAQNRDLRLELERVKLARDQFKAQLREARAKTESQVAEAKRYVETKFNEHKCQWETEAFQRGLQEGIRQGIKSTLDTLPGFPKGDKAHHRAGFNRRQARKAEKSANSAN